MSSEYLIVGLGNPGRQYAGNRHNIGFMVLDQLVRDWGAGFDENKWNGELCRLVAHSTGLPANLVLVKPQTFMNRSGQSVAPALQFYKIKPEHMLVVHDEVELGFGDLRLKSGGGHKGHNGLRDIFDRIGTRDFDRLRFGVGRPEHPNIADYLLSDFSRAEQVELPTLIQSACGMIRDWIQSFQDR